MIVCKRTLLIWSQLLLQKNIHHQLRNMSSGGEVEVLVFGSAIVDFICYVDRLPKAGETLHGHKFANGYGGKGANQCVAAAKLGSRTAIIAKLGDDAWGTNYLEQMRKEHVNIQHVKQCKGESTGIAQISVANNGENSIVIVVGANNLLSNDDVANASALFSSAKVLVCQLEVPVSATLHALRTFKGISILNAAPALKNTPKELLTTATIFCVNETEAALMIDSENISTLQQAKVALQKLLEMGGNTIIISLGALGAVYATKEEPKKYIHVPTQKVESVVDTTGAGDAFIGALAFFIVRFPTLPLHQQIGGACEIASYTVQYPGTQSSFPYAANVNLELAKTSYKYQEL